MNEYGASANLGGAAGIGAAAMSAPGPLKSQEPVSSQGSGSSPEPASAPHTVSASQAPQPGSPLQAAALVMVRDLKLAFRKRGQWIQPLIFFAIVTALFPLGISPEPAKLRSIAPAAVWIGALLASLLALEFLFRDDAHDGTLEQYALSGQSLTWLLLAKMATHWLLTGLPLAIMAPVAALSLGAPIGSVAGIVAATVIGSAALSLIGSIGAALTLGVRRSGALLPLLTLPLSVPVLIFGARATELAIGAESYSAPLYLLGAFAVLGITLAPLAAAVAVRISLE